MRRIARTLLTFAMLATLVPLTSSALAQDPDGTAPGGAGTATPKPKGVVSLTISKASQEAALAFWTRQQIAAAQPLELPAQAGLAQVDAAALNQPETGEAPGFAPSGFAAPGADAVAAASYPEDWKAVEASIEQAADNDQPTGTSQVFTSYIVNQASALQTMYPHRWVGRISFRTPSGTSYCSGTALSGNVMVTAAHCLYDTSANRWYSGWVFAPAYRNGSAPFGTFAATRCWVLTNWVNLSGSYSINSWARHDVGVCKMGNNSSRTSLNNAVGWMGRQWNYPSIRHFHTMGYPFRNYNNAALPSAGLYLRTCVAESFQQTTDTRGMGCNLGGGISGGPWVVNYAPNVVAGFVDGVNSGIYIGTQNIYGARFNSNNIVVLCNAAVC